MLQRCDLLLGNIVHKVSNPFHEFSKLLTHGSEVTLHFLYQQTFTFHEVQLLHVDLSLNQICHRIDSAFLFFIDGRNHHLLQWLTYLNIHFATQCQYHARHFLCQVHACFQVLVDQLFIGNRERFQMHTLRFASQVKI